MYCTQKKIHRCLVRGEWRQVDTKTMKYPAWVDEHTRGCPHPDGVILAGSSKESDEKKVVFLDMHHKKVVELQDLEHILKNVGMVYDDNIGKLTIAGGENPDGTLSRLVWQLPHVSQDAVWEELKVLEEPVANPMLVNDEEYLYVLGGANCTKCARMRKEPKNEDEKEWNALEDLPREGLKTMEYCGGLNSGALVCEGKVTVFTRTKFLALEDTKKTWIAKPYGDDPKMDPMKPKVNIMHLTPISHGETIAAGIQRKFRRRSTVEILQTDPEGNKYWEIFKPAHKRGRLGAGRFVSVKMEMKDGIERWNIDD